MKKTTTYLFIYSTSQTAQIVRAIICALAGGYRLPTDSFCFVFIGKAEEQAKSDIRLYQKAQKFFSAYHTILFSQEIVEMVELLEEPRQCDCCLLFQEKNGKPLENILNCLARFDMKQISDNDRVVVVSQIECPESLAVYEWLSAYLEKTFVQHICVTDYVTDEQKQYIHNFLLDNYTGKDTTIMVGLHRHPTKTAMTLVQSAEMILCPNRSVVGGIPQALDEPDNMYYTQQNLSSKVFADSLSRIALLDIFRKMCADNHPKISKWIKGMEMGDKNIWNNGDDFVLMQIVLLVYDELVKSMPSDHFQVAVDEETIDAFVSNLNKKIAPLKGLREEDKRKLRMAGILESTSGALPLSDKSEVKYRKWNCNQIVSDCLFYNLARIPSPSPTYPWEFTNTAFSKGFQSDKRAKAVRSRCLDLWEMFFGCDKSGINKKFGISEYGIDKLCEKEKNILRISSVGMDMLKEHTYFKIVTIGNNVYSFTSPLTGFAFIDTETATDDYENVKELKDRNENFQHFMYNYTRCIGGFSEEFTNYINCQLDQSQRNRLESLGRNILKIYPQYRKHIALTITKKQ